ncbi:hypothetical protein QR98_0027170 [Sarcoptes scabiei]|uniref:Uncharacterized protein n=1 Tax=Sarcoptes scabiei TaxID=52283 RepID=A0A132A014_SARSC|nr:hypothetical protein QR98_0027170 [Sarcoptes scabiei]
MAQVKMTWSQLVQNQNRSNVYPKSSKTDEIMSEQMALDLSCKDKQSIADSIGDFNDVENSSGNIESKSINNSEYLYHTEIYNRY